MKDFNVYKITNLLNGKEYVGLTQRTLSARFNAHVYDALERRRGKKGSLQSAIRDASRNGKNVENCFPIKLLHANKSKEEAGRLEDELIVKLNTMFPHGLNMIKGGGSFGSPANAKKIIFDHSGCSYSFTSIMKAVKFVKKTFGIDNKVATVSRRIREGHSIKEALGLIEFKDKRKFGQEVLCNGRVRDSLEEIADELNIPPETARSRIYRNRNKPNYDVATHAKPQKISIVRVPNPEDIHGQLISGAEFIKITGVCESTFYTRLRQCKDNGSYEKMTPKQLVEFLSKGKTDRRKIISLTLPNGQVLNGGVNELCDQFLDAPEMKAFQVEKVNTRSSIKGRLRRSNYRDIEWAFGLKRNSISEVDTQKTIVPRRNNPSFKRKSFYSDASLICCVIHPNNTTLVSGVVKK